MERPVVHYHGSPIWGGAGSVARVAYRDGGAFISYVRHDQIALAFEVAREVGIDNGAFSAWKRGLTLDWGKFYAWLMRYYHHSKLSFFVIPDVIEGGEKDNDRLIDAVPQMFIHKAVPVWHLHESIDRLVDLATEFPRIAFGSSGQYAVIGTAVWKERMREAFRAIYVTRNCETIVHGLRMLDGRVLGVWPLATADSTNLACNVPKTLVKYPQLTRGMEALGADDTQIKEGRCAILRNAIESVFPPTPETWAQENQ